MSRLVLHIGMSKTGTTAFQAFIRANRDLLSAHGLSYPGMLRGPNHSQLPVAFSPRVNVVSRSLGVESDADRARLRRRLQRRLARDADDADAWIVSSEQLSTMVRRRRDISHLADFLHDVFDEVQIVVVLRRQDYWLPSSYVEYVTSGGTRRLAAHFVAYRAYFLDHIRFLRRWAAAFGPDKVRAVPFLELDKRQPAVLPARILAVAGLPEVEVQRWPVPSALRNVSLSSEAAEILRRINPQLSSSGWRPVTTRNRIASAIGESWPGPPPALTPEAVAALNQLGVLHAAIRRTGLTSRDGWHKWHRQPDAPIAPPPPVPATVVATASEMLEKAGLLSHGPDFGAAETLRRWAIRLARR